MNNEKILRVACFISDLTVWKLVNLWFSIILSYNLYRQPCNNNLLIDGLCENAPLFNEIKFS